MGMGRVMILAVVVWLGACAQSSSLVCGDGRTCPGNSTCDDLHHICVSPSQRAACDGLQNGETCTFEGQVGLCDEGVCIGASCGNTVVDADEACDDGNRDDGDGCRGDCKKIERCGDALVDEGEACDDGNTKDGDACPADCGLEDPGCGCASNGTNPAAPLALSLLTLGLVARRRRRA